MKITKAEFISSSPGVRQCPISRIPDFAFIGRSNVGKSSLINMITGRNALAKVSQTPGKTRLINHFNINDEWMLVDLPGYGYAKMSKPDKEKIERMIQEYLSKRETLVHTYLLIDSRHELQKNDILFIHWLNRHQIRFTIIATKTDKISKDQLARNVKSYFNILLNINVSTEIISTSSEKKTGREEILDHIESILSNFVTQTI
jgi:GTP-binding protein